MVFRMHPMTLTFSDEKRPGFISYSLGETSFVISAPIYVGSHRKLTKLKTHKKMEKCRGYYFFHYLKRKM